MGSESEVFLNKHVPIAFYFLKYILDLCFKMPPLQAALRMCSYKKLF